MFSEVMTIDADKYEYVIDKGPATDFQVDERGELQSLSSLRVFGLRKGYTEFTKIPGHYMINTWTGAEAEGLQSLQAPALVHFKDRGLLPAFVLEWKWMNDKLYGQTLATTVKVGNSNDPDKRCTWLTQADVRPVRLALIDSVQPINNRDGVPLKKNFETWLAEHSGERRKVLGLTSLAAHKNWCGYETFSNNFSKVANMVEAAMEKSLREGNRTGLPDQIRSGNCKANATIVAHVCRFVRAHQVGWCACRTKSD